VPPVSAVWYDNFVLGAYLATLTKRIRLLFSVMVVPYRPPVQMAKLISTLDVVSNGRLTVGVGAGWLKGEFRVLGVPYEERGALTDEYLRAMKALWTMDNPEFQGKHVAFTRLAFEPKCVQKPHAPVWIGGSGPRPRRRVVELGDGWMPMVGDLPELAKEIALVKEQARRAGRDGEKLSFNASVAFGERDETSETARAHASRGAAEKRALASSPGEVTELVGRYREAGFTNLSLSFNWRTPDEYIRQIEWFAGKVMPAFA
jgi:probable F420-dependent oxidoreductase